MPRIITSAEKHRAIVLMLKKDEAGKFVFGQRDIEMETGLSRPYLRKLAKEVGHQFPRNGIEVKGTLCMCSNCSALFRKPPSRVKRAKHQFCDEVCRESWMKGANHGAWDHGKSASTWSSWVKNQKAYKDWQEAVLKRDNYTCQISGRTDNLQAHHIFMKAESMNPEKAFDVDNGITMNFEVHQRIHQLIREGWGFEESLKMIKKEYSQEGHVV
jgi:5-methylcytosine-specific restriction endonuclease McrA